MISHQVIKQPIEVYFQPTTKKKSALSFEVFLELLRSEENYFESEVNNTKLMVTRLRKIFYDAYGWNSELIRGAAHIQGRYQVKTGPTNTPGHYRREVQMQENDWMNPNRGMVPMIFSNNNQEVILPSGHLCDIGHVLVGIDCHNNPAPVSPLPNFLMWAHKFFPYGDRNTDVSTWLGDISTSSGEFLFKKVYNTKESSELFWQELIQDGASGQDMLGNIDGYVIARFYDTASNSGSRVSDILEDYYGQYRDSKSPVCNRIALFCEAIGLRDWNGEQFANETAWLSYYTGQLRNTTVFYIGTRFPFPGKYLYALLTWLRFFDREMKITVLPYVFLQALKDLMPSLLGDSK